MMTRQEMIDEAVRGVLVGRRFWVPISTDPATRDYPFAWVKHIPVTLNLMDAIQYDFLRIEAEAARSAVAQTGIG